MGITLGGASVRERVPLPYRLLAVVAAIPVIALAREAAAVAADKPLVALSWVVMLSLSSLMAVVAVPRFVVEASLRTPVTIASVLVLDPLLALLVNVVALVSVREFRREVSGWKILYNHLQVGLGAYLAALIVHVLPLDVHSQPLHAVVATIIAVPIFDAANTVAVALATWLSGYASLIRTLRSTASPFPRFATNYVFIGLLALLIVVLYTRVAPWAIALLAVPLWLGYAALRSAKAASDRADELAARVRELEVLHDLGTALLKSQDAAHVVAVASPALLELCGSAHPDEVVLALDGEVPPRLQQRTVPGTSALVGLPAELDERRIAEVDTACNAIGLALQRLAVEGELRASQRAETELAAGILAEGSAARSRIGLHVHDNVLPYLAAAAIQSENVITAADMENPALTTKLAGRVRDAVTSGISALREVLDDLQRQTIVPGDLLPSVRRAAEQARVEHGLQVDLDVEELTGGLSHPVEILLTETVTGLLTNVVRHADASHVTVGLRTEDGVAVAEVRDDGVGFEVDEVGAGHHGLALMRQRAALAHGQFSIDSAPGRGTTIRLAVPVRTTGALSSATGLEAPRPTGQEARPRAVPV